MGKNSLLHLRQDGCEPPKSGGGALRRGIPLVVVDDMVLCPNYRNVPGVDGYEFLSNGGDYEKDGLVVNVSG